MPAFCESCGNCGPESHIPLVVDFQLSLDDGDAGESVCVELPGVGHRLENVYGTVTPISTHQDYNATFIV